MIKLICIENCIPLYSGPFMNPKCNASGENAIKDNIYYASKDICGDYYLCSQDFDYTNSYEHKSFMGVFETKYFRIED